MKDPRIEKIAKLLVEHSVNVKKNDAVRISMEPEASPLALEVYRLCVKKGAFPYIRCGVPGAGYIYYKYASDAQLKKFPKVAMFEEKNTDAVINISGDYNTREFSNIDPKKMALRSRVTKPLSDYRMKKDRWVGCDYPTNALAQEANMSLEEYEDFAFGAMSVDSKNVMPQMLRIKKLLDKTNIVRIVGKNTDLSFSVKGMTSMAEYATHNVPDGEVFTSPVKNSVNGHIAFSYPAIRAGNEVSGIWLEFRNGKVVKEKAEKNLKFLKAMLDMDEYSRFIGEFGIGCNYKISKFTKNLLFDEKIGGTIHLALGHCYPENCKGNEKNANTKSALHWDILKDFRFDGGEVYFDKKLIQKNGKFLV